LTSPAIGYDAAMNPVAEDPLRARMVTPQVLWFALNLSIVIYGFVAWNIATHAPEPGVDPGAMLIPLAVVAVATMGIVPVVRRVMSPPRRAAASIDDVPSAPADDPRVGAAVQKWFSMQIVSWALCESIAIYGLILTILSHDLRYFFPFAAGAIVNLILYRPSRDELLSVLRAVEKPAA
jgi:F0F1-type ATP synthase membrane subunit c/vacuolar-type H+-ATPase subunit K